jgi:hypothetical protein
LLAKARSCGEIGGIGENRLDRRGQYQIAKIDVGDADRLAEQRYIFGVSHNGEYIADAEILGRRIQWLDAKPPDAGVPCRRNVFRAGIRDRLEWPNDKNGEQQNQDRDEDLPPGPHEIPYRDQPSRHNWLPLLPSRSAPQRFSPPIPNRLATSRLRAATPTGPGINGSF